MRKLVAFKAAWCGPCKMLTPVLEDLIKAGYNIEMVDVDEQTDLAEANNVRTIPTLDFFEDGKKYRRVQGNIPKGEIIKYFTEGA